MGIVAAASIAVGGTLRHAVEDAHHPAATAAAHQPGQERAAAAGGFARAALLHVGVLEEQLLVVLVLLPADVGGVVVAQQHVPLLLRLVEPADLASTAVDDPRPLPLAAEGVGPGIERVVQDLHDAVVGRRLPREFADVDVAQNERHLDVHRAQPQEDLARAAQLAELGEHEADGLDYVLVRVHLDPACLAPA